MGTTKYTGDVTVSGTMTATTGLTATTSFLLPQYTTGGRPAAAAANKGLLIYNTTTNKLNFSTGSAWEAVTSA